MMRKLWTVALVIGLTIVALERSSPAYIEVAYTLGQLARDSSNILLVKVESVDREKNIIVYRKVEDIKGKHPTDVIRHNIAHAGFNAREWQNVMAWAAEGKIAVICHNVGASETCIANYWYQAYPRRGDPEWWDMYHGEPYLLRSYAGKPEKLVDIFKAMLAGEDVVVPCMVDGDKNALALRTARIQRMRASLRLIDYNPARDFAGWGGDEIRPILDMAAFGQMSVLPNLESGSGWGVAVGHLENASRSDVVMFNEDRVTILKNEGEGSFNTVEHNGARPPAPPAPAAPAAGTPPAPPPPAPAAAPAPTPAKPLGGARGAAWCDYNGSKRDSLLLATPQGPRLLTNIAGALRDDSAALPTWGYTGLTAAAWLKNFRGGGDKPAMLLADQFAGLRLLENTTPALEEGKSEIPAPVFKDISDSVGLGANGLAASMKIEDLLVADLLNDGSQQVIVNGAAGRVLVLSFKNGKFEELKLTGLYWSWRARIAAADIDSDGRLDIVAVSTGGTRVFRNLGKGKFEDFTRKSGLASVGGTSLAMVPVPAQAGNLQNKTFDLLVGCTRAANRYFKNNGRGVFKEATADLGFDRRIFNTRAVAALPAAGASAPDLVMVNEGQPSCVLLWKK